MNVFARELGVSFDLEHAWQTAQGGRESRVDVARADFAAPTGTARRYFVQLAGAGWDSRAVAQVDLNLKRRIGALAYIVAGLKAWREGLPSVTVSDGQRTLAGPLVAVGNGQYYGGSFRLFPRADLRDGLLDVTVFRRVGVGPIVRAGWGLLANRLYREGGAEHFCASSVELTSAAPMPLQLEGESVGHLPARLSVVPKALRVRVP
jgi:diacylglycerol kinase family enzyme